MLTFFLSLLAGLLASLNPCTVPIYPIIFSYYLKQDNHKSIKKTILFISGFLIAFILLAMIILSLNIGVIQEAIRFIIAGITSLLGILFLIRDPNFGKLESITSKIESPFLFGIIFGMALNPCSLPLFLATATLSISVGSIINIIGFGIGVAIPPILFAIFGSSLIKKISEHTRGAYKYLNKIVGAFLLLSAVFLIFLISATPTVAVISSIFILLFFILLILPFWRNIFKIKKYRTSLITLTTSLFLLWGVLTFRCHQVSFSTHYSCGLVCIPCRICLSMLLGVLIIGFIGFSTLERISKHNI